VYVHIYIYIYIVSHGCDAWSLALGKENKLQACEEVLGKRM
jgi:hypothetical protein